MSYFLKNFLRSATPFPLRVLLSRMRITHGLVGIFGRISAGGFKAYISFWVKAHRWQQVHVGAFSIVNRGTQFHSNDDEDEKRIVIGEYCHIGQNCFFSAGELILINSHSIVGASCNLLAAGHIYDDPTQAYGTAKVVSYGKMRIGSNVWVGTGCTIVGDVEVGFGSIIAAGSILRASLPPLSMAAGNPARIIKLFDWKSQSWVRLSGNELLLSEKLVNHFAMIPNEADYLKHLKYRI
jgi:acetyltransferase-like isoleucine patch superfamily enzyme